MLTQTIVHSHKDGSGDITFETRQDVSAILEDAKARSNEGYHGSSEMRHAARLPMAAIDRYCNDKGITFHEWCSNKTHVRAMLNDPDLSAFRVWGGKV